MTNPLIMCKWLRSGVLPLGAFALSALFPVVALAQASTARPNVVVILVDDAGYTDFPAFGGEARMPAISALAEQGSRFSRYHTSPLCSPSRAMLLTGIDNHQTGVATIPEVLTADQKGRPGYSMYLEPGVQTIADRLKTVGYRTYMTGKWHLGRRLEDLPNAHGFDRSFALDASGADNYEQKPYMPYYTTAPWFEDGEPAELPKDFYSSKFIVDKMLEYLDSGIDSNAESAEPFFAYMAFQAIHIPIQAPREFTDSYNGVYDQGWHVLLEKRWKRARQLGLIPANAPKPMLHEALRQWDSLSADEKALYARSMQVNAGMLEAMDHHIGRFVDELKATGQFENTLFVITSDNGPEPSNPLTAGGPFAGKLFKLWMKQNGYEHELETLGEKGSMAFIDREWASAASSPGRLFKFFASEGGLRVPMIMSGPGVPAGKLIPAMTVVTDITPTILDYAGAEFDNDENTVSGRSLRPLLSGDKTSVYSADDSIGIEVSGNAALYLGEYKLVRNQLPYGDGSWQLFDVVADPGETNNLAISDPELLESMIIEYQQYAQRVGVIDPPEGFHVYKQLRSNVLKKQAMVYLPGLLSIIGMFAVGFWLIKKRRRG